MGAITYAIALGIAQDPVKAEKVVLEGYLTLWRHPELALQHCNSIRAYLCAVVACGARLRHLTSRSFQAASPAYVLKSYLRDDDEILTAVVEGVIRGSMWIDPATLEVEVDDGVVRMCGQVQRRSEVEVIATLTRGAEGVMDVESSLTFRFDDRGVQPPKEQRHI